MSVHRYSFGGDLTATMIQRVIDQGVTPTVMGIGADTLIDISLSSDTAKPDLDEYLFSLGWVFVSTSPTTPRPTLNHTTVQAGRNGDTLTGAFYRGIDGMVLDAANLGLPVPVGTLKFLGWSKTSAASSTLEVLNNGSVIATLVNPGVGVVSSYPDVSVALGLLSFRNLAAGATTSNVQITAVVC